ncbi:hypothetical protein PQ459_12145 [Chryseobacterium sp. KACC 21268]|nr:hypothetical protein PQ459_12145 [Chryseobacterium sp. KACC 21268]
MRLYSLFAILLFTSGFSQVGIGTVAPHSSAILDMTATNKGLLLPRVNLTGTNDNATISNPANGLLVFNLAAAGSGSTAVSANSFYYRQNNLWQKFTSSTEINVLEGSNQYVLKSVTNQPFTATQLTSLNSSETFEVPITWSSTEILIDDPNDIELLTNNQSFRIKATGNYRVLANFTFSPKRNVAADNSNFSYVTISITQSKDNGVTWTPVVGTAMPYDNGSTDQTQTLILPRTVLSFAQNDLIRISISKPGATTPAYGTGAGIVAKATDDITKLFRIRRIN